MSDAAALMLCDCFDSCNVAYLTGLGVSDVKHASGNALYSCIVWSVCIMNDLDDVRRLLWCPTVEGGGQLDGPVFCRLLCGRWNESS